MNKEWEDITELLKEAVGEIPSGSFIAADDFNYEASMRSIDIMDKKVDVGMSMVGFDSIETRLRENRINFYPDEASLLQIAECLFSSFGSWVKGENLNHSMLRVVFMHISVANRLQELFKSTPAADTSEEATHLSVLVSLISQYINIIVNIRNRIVSESILGPDEFDTNAYSVPAEFEFTAEEVLRLDNSLKRIKDEETKRKLSIHITFLSEMNSLFSQLKNCNKASMNSLRSRFSSFISLFSKFKSVYPKEPEITESDTFNERYSFFVPSLFPSRPPPVFKFATILSDLEIGFRITYDYVVFLSSRTDFLTVLRELMTFSLRPTFPFMNAIIVRCFFIMYPETQSQLDLFAKTCHCDATVFHQNSLKEVCNKLQYVEESLIKTMCSSSTCIQRKLDTRMVELINLSNEFLEELQAKKTDKKKPFTAEDRHKLVFFPCLIAFYLGLCNLNYELRLGLWTENELPVMLWFMDSLISQFKEYEVRYAVLPPAEKKNKAKLSPRSVEVTPLLTEYWSFLVNYERGLLFYLVACIKLHIIKRDAPTFCRLDVLFEQRINFLMSTGIIPKPRFSDFESIFTSDKYEPIELLNKGVLYFEEAQKFVATLKQKSSVVSETMVREDCMVYQRVILMNIFTGKKLLSSCKGRSIEEIQKSPGIRVEIEIQPMKFPILNVVK